MVTPDTRRTILFTVVVLFGAISLIVAGVALQGIR